VLLVRPTDPAADGTLQVAVARVMVSRNEVAIALSPLNAMTFRSIVWRRRYPDGGIRLVQNVHFPTREQSRPGRRSMDLSKTADVLLVVSDHDDASANAFR